MMIARLQKQIFVTTMGVSGIGDSPRSPRRYLCGARYHAENGVGGRCRDHTTAGLPDNYPDSQFKATWKATGSGVDRIIILLFST